MPVCLFLFIIVVFRYFSRLSLAVSAAGFLSRSRPTFSRFHLHLFPLQCQRVRFSHEQVCSSIRPSSKLVFKKKHLSRSMQRTATTAAAASAAEKAKTTAATAATMPPHPVAYPVEGVGGRVPQRAGSQHPQQQQRPQKRRKKTLQEAAAVAER